MRQSRNSSGMAGEFHVMELLYRLGHEPAMTLGNAKSIDILTLSPNGNHYEVSVKSVCGGGKWGIGNEDYSAKPSLRFVLLHYRYFNNVLSIPDVWIVPADVAEKIKKPWHSGFAIYSYKEYAPLLEPYRDAWQFLS